MKPLYIIILSLWAIVTNAQVGNTLKGQILSADDLRPIKEAYVEVKHKTIRTLTDKEGDFSLQGVAIYDTLIISHIGYESQQFIVSSFSVVSIRLTKAAKELEEVALSTGYQKIPKERSTGSFTQIDNKLFNEQVGTNILERLKYISNGVTYFPNRVQTVAGDQLIIRGISTLTMSIQKPLIIVDNFEYQGDLNNINPNDVENITFLKDAAAGSIWGAKAANGVIVVTTKKSRYNQKTKIELNTNITIAENPDLFYYKNISSSDLIDVEKYLFSQNYRLSDTLSPLHTPFSPVYEILLKQRNGQISESEANVQIDALRTQDVRNDFLKYLYRKAVNQQYAISLRGGSDNISWVLSAGFDRNLSDLDAQYNRANFRLDNLYKIAKNLEINTSVYYTQSKSITGRPAYGSIQTVTGSLPGYTKLADDNGNALPLYTRYRQGYIDTLGGGKLLDWTFYPLEDYKHAKNRTQLRDINAVIGFNYRLSNWLNIDFKYRYEKQQVEIQTLNNDKSYITRDLINSFSQIDPSTGGVKYIIPNGAILDQGYTTITAQNIRGQLNFNRQWGIHSLTAIAGSDINETANSSNLYRTYGYNSDILTFVNVDYTSQYPNLIYGGSSWIPNPAIFDKTNTRFVSFYGNASYVLHNKYAISGSMRRDASNLFGVDMKDKWKPLWSVGASWNISDELFYHLKKISKLRLRVTYGYQGNIDPSKVGATTFIYYSANAYTSTPSGGIQTFINPDLKWEQTRVLNTALDFSTKKNRISGSVEYYHKNITDLYGPSVIDPTTGLGTSTIIKNVGNMKGSGLDVHITTRNIDKGFKWITDFIFNTYKDKVTKYYYNDSSLKASQLVGFGGGLEGYSPFSLIVYKWAGLASLTGDPQGYIGGHVSKDWISITGSGSTKDDIKYIGSRLPTIFGSIGNIFRWKNISLTARLTYKFKYHFLRESISYSSLISGLHGHADYALRWQQPGDEKKTFIPSFVYPANSARDAFYSNSEILVEKGDHVRFQYLNLGYDIGKDKIKKLPVEHITFYGVINNLGIIWRANKKGIDPDYSSVPLSRAYSVGIKASF